MKIEEILSLLTEEEKRVVSSAMRRKDVGWCMRMTTGEDGMPINGSFFCLLCKLQAFADT